MKRNRTAFFFAVLILWTGVTLYLTLMPGGVIQPRMPLVIAKLGHVVLFGGWAIIAGITVAVWHGASRLNLFVLWIAAVTFGAAVELLQTFVAVEREGSLRDVAINAIGVTAACLILRYRRRRSAETPRQRGHTTGCPAPSID